MITSPFKRLINGEIVYFRETVESWKSVKSGERRWKTTGLQIQSVAMRYLLLDTPDCDTLSNFSSVPLTRIFNMLSHMKVSTCPLDIIPTKLLIEKNLGPGCSQILLSYSLKSLGLTRSSILPTFFFFKLPLKKDGDDGWWWHVCPFFYCLIWLWLLTQYNQFY